jgi:hypothetical protein
LALLSGCVAILVAALAFAEIRPTLAGTWTGGPLVERYSVGEWGDACGPRPVDREKPGGPAVVREEGNELVVAAEDRTFRTDQCWEELPGVAPTSHTATDRSWQTGCASATDDPRQTVLVTSLKATDTTITLEEVAQYQFRIDRQNCTVSARRARTWTLVKRQGEPVGAGSAPPSASNAAPRPVLAPPPAPSLPGAPSTSSSSSRPATRCAVPGPPAQVEVHPARKLLRPGERFVFRTTAIDANGCPVDPRATWTLGRSSTQLTLAPGGTVQVDADATDGTAELTVSSAGRFTRVSVEIATPSRYEALLATADYDAAAGDESTASFNTGASIGASSATAQDTAHVRKTIFVVLIGVLALALAALGLVLVRRAPVLAAADRSDAEAMLARAAPEPPTPGGVVVRARPAAAAVRAMVCPSCRSEFPPKSAFCPHDGNRLVAIGAVLSFQGPTIGPPGGICPTCGRGYDPGVKTCPTHGDDLVPVAVYRATAHRHAPTPERGKICPNCGGRYGGEAAFCGKDGTALVLVN